MANQMKLLVCPLSKPNCLKSMHGFLSMHVSGVGVSNGQTHSVRDIQYSWQALVQQKYEQPLLYFNILVTGYHFKCLESFCGTLWQGLCLGRGCHGNWLYDSLKTVSLSIRPSWSSERDEKSLNSPPWTKSCSVQSEGPTRWIRLDWLKPTECCSAMQMQTQTHTFSTEKMTYE